MYGIVRCPKCGSFQGFELRYKTISCTNCGKRCNLARSSTFGPFIDQVSMRRSLWDIKAGKMDDGEISLKEEMIMKDPSDGERPTKNKSLQDETVYLAIKKGYSDLDIILENLKDRDLDKEQIIKAIDRLLISERIYCPKPGIYAVIP